MNTRRLAGIAALAMAAASVLVIPGAGAQQTTYGAKSDGQSLGLLLFGQEITAGKSHSELASGPKASAKGAGIITPLSPAGVTEAAVDGADATKGSATETCEGEIALPDAISFLGIDLACSSSLATIAKQAPSSAGTARVSTVNLTPVQPFLATPIADVIQGIQDGEQQITQGLAPLFEPLAEGGLDLGGLIDDFTAALDQAPLATVTIGTVKTSTTATATTVSSECLAQGGRVDILDTPPVGGVDLPPVISIIIGDAASSVTVDPATGEAKPVINPSLVTVVVPSLDIEQKVTIGQTIEIPLPEPIGTSFITVAGGSSGKTPEGDTFARASAVRLDLLNGEALQGGIELSLADCLTVAGASTTPAETTTSTTTSTVAPEPSLPRTGGTSPNGLAIFAAVGLAGLGVTLLRRSSVV